MQNRGFNNNVSLIDLIISTYFVSSMGSVTKHSLMRFDILPQKLKNKSYASRLLWKKVYESKYKNYINIKKSIFLRKLSFFKNVNYLKYKFSKKFKT